MDHLEYQTHRVGYVSKYQLDFGGPHAGTAWDVKPMVTLMCPGSFYKKGLQLGEDYVVERCIHENGDARAWKVHLFQYSGSFPRVCVWEYERAETVGFWYILLDGYILLIPILPLDNPSAWQSARRSYTPGFRFTC